MDNLKQQFDDLVSKTKHIIITCHTNPDEDAIASVLSVYEYLSKTTKNKTIRMVIAPPVKPDWDFLKNANLIEWVDPANVTNNADLVIFNDGQTRDRFSYTPEKIDLTKFKTIHFDHHPGPIDNFDLNIVDISKPASVQLIAELLFADDKFLTPEVAEILMVGILGDTGNFNYLDYKKCSVLTTVQRIMEIGKIDIQVLDIKRNQFTNKVFELYQILIANTKNISLPNFPPLSFSYLPKSVVDKYGYPTISNAYHTYMSMITRHIKDHPWGFIVVPGELGTDYFKIDFRSTSLGPDVGQLARDYFNGGGHKYASGGKFFPEKNEEVDTAVKKILEKLKKLK